jgi:hypothetical protein
MSASASETILLGFRGASGSIPEKHVDPFGREVHFGSWLTGLGANHRYFGSADLLDP